jgi:hypothetical protein
MRTFVIAFLLLVSFTPASASEPDPQEAGKIRYLISSVETLQGATFIRNGTEHSPRDAAEHLRMKLKKAGKRVRTAEDFIKLCASRSFLSGEPYLIKYDNGSVVRTEAFLREKLKVFGTAAK